ncbi:MAG TPA: histidine kinase [Mycobacteriales bacterium]|nr:histidine kinase [Mycobacteriales bacterium]
MSGDARVRPARWRALWSVIVDHPGGTDVAVAAVLSGLGLFGIWLFRITYADVGHTFSTPWAVGGMLGMAVPLAVRHRYPASVLIVSSVAFAAFRLEEIPEGTISSVVLFLALYSAGAYLPARRGRWLRGLVIAVLTAMLMRELFLMRDDETGARLQSVVVAEQAYAVLLNLFFFLIAWLLGDAVRRRREREVELAQRATELARANAVIAEQAVTEERVRMARELHDVVAHHVSVMGIQAGAARRVLARDPVRAASVLSSIEESSRQAVGELHRILGFLRHTGEPDGTSPQPTLAEVADLVDRMRTAGLDIRLAVTGEPGPLPPAVELSAYRIVQEALTNTLKHAGSQARTEVLLDYRPTELRLSILDDGPAAMAGAGGPVGNGSRRAGGGRGLIGMRERVGLLGGALAAGPRPGVGYQVQATIPV